MSGLKLPVRKATKEEAEKPFWISFSDLMTALMVLFLVAMAAALMDARKKIDGVTAPKTIRDADIFILHNNISVSIRDIAGVSLRGSTIDFGDRARFASEEHKLTVEQARILRAVVRKILAAGRDPLGAKWFKRVLVEGFADQRGTYIYNLNLSLQRSERVLCVLLASFESASDALSEQDRRDARELFLVGGSSFNSLQKDFEASRRIELKLEFLDEPRSPGESWSSSRDVPLDNDPRCPLDRRIPDRP